MPFLRLVNVLLVLCSVGTASATEIMHYDNKPKTIELVTGDERTIQFGDHIAVGTTPSQDALFRVQSAQGALHILAYAPFEKQRIQIKRLGDGRILLFDVSASTATSEVVDLEDITVLMPDENELKTRGLSETTNRHRDRAQSGQDITPIELTRYAAHRFYAPQRLHRSHPSISAQPLGDMTSKALRVFKGVIGAQTSVSAITAYRAGSHHLVALLVVNTHRMPITLDYLSIAVPFHYATLQHHTLAPAGEAGDRTMLYLISDRPARAFLMPWDQFSTVKEVRRGE